ncbi:ComF family protein [Myroides sp. C15-4]|uniref:ComF family protein n=1 Tax=Myroides sp. C15-4 TaxID=3400532 RepID=UPI003D2F6F6F
MLQDVLHLFLPHYCCGCSTLLLQQEDLLCVSCRTFLPFTDQHCHTPNEALNKFYGKVKINHASCMLYYTKEGIVSRLLHQLKYNNQPKISYTLGRMYAELLAETAHLDTVDYLIPVPMHKRKQRQRGYNQVDGFADALAYYFGIPVNRTLLTKITHTPSQTTKTFQERIKTKITTFYLGDSSSFIGKHLLLLDDILTTGSTLETCAKLLLQIPGCKVSILCLAYTK